MGMEREAGLARLRRYAVALRAGETYLAMNMSSQIMNFGSNRPCITRVAKIDQKTLTKYASRFTRYMI